MGVSILGLDCAPPNPPLAPFCVHLGGLGAHKMVQEGAQSMRLTITKKEIVVPETQTLPVIYASVRGEG